MSASEAGPPPHEKKATRVKTPKIFKSNMLPPQGAPVDEAHTR
jgi:hypothetical protein